MKIAYTSVFCDGTGYASAAIDTVLALDSVGVDVVPINVKLATQYVDPPDRIKELFKKSRQNCDVVVQNILAPYFQYVKGVKNIGYFFWETDDMRPSGWQYYANLMDEVWVSCPENKEALLKTGFKKPIKIVPIPADFNKYKNVEILDFGKNKHKYKFYHIGDYSSRKNVHNLIKCYLEEFSKADNVVLVLKCYVEGTSGAESAKIIQEDIAGLKQSLRKYQVDAYPSIVLIPDYLTPVQIQQIHASCDCFISLERGAAWNIPAFDSLGHSKKAIVTGWGGQTQFGRDLDSKITCQCLDFEFAPVFGMDRCPYNTLYTCHERWAEPNLNDCKSLMRDAYANDRRGTAESARILEFNYNYEACGNKFLKDILVA